jgi:hypothetical protein
MGADNMIRRSIIITSFGFGSLLRPEWLMEVVFVLVLRIVRPILFRKVVKKFSQELPKLGNTLAREDAEVLSLGSIEILEYN